MKKIIFLLIGLCGAIALQAEDTKIDAVRATQGEKTDWFRLGEQNSIVVTINEDGKPVFPDNKIYNLSDGNVVTVFGTAPEDATYTRDVTNGNWGTICLPWASTALEGGDFYNVLGTKDAEKGIALEELGESDQLTAGKPYVFKATSNQIKVTYSPTTEVEDSVYAGNHIYGSFAGCTVPNGKYIIYNNLLYKTDGSSKVGEYRAYFDAESMEAYNPATAPARVVFMGGHQAPTDIEEHNARCTMHDGKYLINGQFVIIKDNKMYNAQGIEL